MFPAVSTVVPSRIQAELSSEPHEFIWKFPLLCPLLTSIPLAQSRSHLSSDHSCHPNRKEGAEMWLVAPSQHLPLCRDRNLPKSPL